MWPMGDRGASVRAVVLGWLAAAAILAAALLAAAPASAADGAAGFPFTGFGFGGGPQLVPGGVTMVELDGRTVTLTRFDGASGERSTLATLRLDPRVDVR